MKLARILAGHPAKFLHMAAGSRAAAVSLSAGATSNAAIANLVDPAKVTQVYVTFDSAVTGVTAGATINVDLYRAGVKVGNVATLPLANGTVYAALTAYALTLNQTYVIAQKADSWVYSVVQGGTGLAIPLVKVTVGYDVA